MLPLVVIRPILFPRLVNHSAPSGPAVISRPPLIVGVVKFVTVPSVVIRPIELLLVNHSAPSGPAVMPYGPVIVGSVKLVTTPLVVMRPIELSPLLVNQSAPSGPAA